MVDNCVRYFFLGFFPVVIAYLELVFITEITLYVYRISSNKTLPRIKPAL